eukprot:CAMPEP_0194248952 /NCGR_PEP_ID=MMETSP0158-20130606/19476_1 /TAXON_ID=33649 /ORGANISM="Thalassionema nitzschioides, Strain L26-B" /LENGTH=72 /DNA_ID=CAMNT_0038985377 /DNA_START=82 /DNA_END=296 /DNA_ORIENTATION=+
MANNPTTEDHHSDVIIKDLEARLLFASQLLGASDFRDATESVVHCPCQKYCMGQCFSSGCMPCATSTWGDER